MISRQTASNYFLLLLVLALCFLLGMVYQQKKILRHEKELSFLNSRLKKVAEFEPDVGDSMRELQPEMAKLWYAAEYKNYPLALYEIKEIKETVDTVQVLKPVVKSTDVAMALNNMVNTPVARMEKALQQHNDARFVSAYKQTLSACNACHAMTGFGFNRIIIPTAPPVSNQDWKPH